MNLNNNLKKCRFREVSLIEPHEIIKLLHETINEVSELIEASEQCELRYASNPDEQHDVAEISFTTEKQSLCADELSELKQVAGANRAIFSIPDIPDESPSVILEYELSQ